MGCGCTCNANLSYRGCVGHATSCARPQTNVVNPFGTVGNDSASYNVDSIAQGDIVRRFDFENAKDYINDERSRRSRSGITIDTNDNQGIIEAQDYNILRDGLTSLPFSGPTDQTCNTHNGQNSDDNGHIRPPSDPTGDCQVGLSYVPTITSMTVGKIITASDFNILIDDIKSSGISCFCNCNYCACNCNYCACNCNYGCTCECNYSDENVKTDIEYL